MIRFFTEKQAKNVVENDDSVSAVEEGDGGNKENEVGNGERLFGCSGRVFVFRIFVAIQLIVQHAYHSTCFHPIANCVLCLLSLPARH